MATNTKLDSLVINYLTQSQYDSAKNAGTLNANQIYMTPASSGSTYTLPAATSSTLGGVKIGSNITVNNGTISISKTNVTNRPKVNTYCPFGLNVTTSGQIFGPAVCIVKTTGEIQVYTGKNNATFGNNSYGWTTNNPNTISWDY